WQRERNTARQVAFVKPQPAAAPVQKPAAVPHPAPVEEEKRAEAPKSVEAPKAPEVPKAPEARKSVEAKKPEEKKSEDRKPASPVQTVAAPPPSGIHRIVMRVETDEAWLEVTDATGRQLVSSLNRAGSERVVQGRGPFTFVIGNASHVRIEHNGREFDLKP